MDKLERKRSALKGRVTTIKTLVDAHATTPLTEISATTLFEKTTKLMEENDTLFQDIVEKCADVADIPPHGHLHEIEELRLIAMKDDLTAILKHFTTLSTSTTSSTASTTASASTSSTSTDIRLPRLELPTFTGNRLDWLQFRDLFRAAVHKNTQLSGAQKLQYLKTAVRGEASSLIQSYPLTDDNFDIAWKTLENRYEDLRELINQMFERLLNSSPIVTENPAQLQKHVDRTNECVRSIDILGVSREQAYELILIFFLSKKLDPESRLQWEKTIKQGTLPAIADYVTFCDYQARVTAAARTTLPKKNTSENKRNTAAVHHGSSVQHQNSTKSRCKLCNEDHPLYNCKKFKALYVNDRWDVVRKYGLCFNCLGDDHKTDKCKSSHCRQCSKYHHTLLHYEPPVKKSQQPTPQETPTETPVGTQTFFSTTSRSKGLLSTALIRIQSVSGEMVLFRALLDNGSETSFITSSCATRLGLRRQRISVPLSGIAGANAGTAKEMVDMTFSSCHRFEPTFKIKALILSTLTKELPASAITYTDWPHLRGLELADPHFMDISKIDVLLGADIFYELMGTGKIDGPPGTPIALNSALGWILGGRIRSDNHRTHTVSTFMTRCDLDDRLKQFWELEELPRQKFLTPEEKSCDEHFATTHTRDSTGRFVVRLPWKENAKPLGDSRAMAVNRLKAGERRNSTDPVRKKIYEDVMEEYLQLNHMELLPVEPKMTTAGYYLPHHAVENSASTTTPFRIVFDASAKTTTGVSLNHNLLVGPKLQEDLISILIRFRKHPIVLTADISKMYRQVLVHPDDLDYQRIVWRKDITEPVRDYKLRTATFGTAAAPYLAIKCLQQLAKDEEKDFPEAATVIQQDFYVDDLMSGAATEQDAVKLQTDLRSLLARGGMGLRKWSSNSETVLSAIPVDLRETEIPLNIDTDSGIKTLGLQWHPHTDNFSYRVTFGENSSNTKRKILSELAKIYDPLGWLSPVIITAKIFMQSLWKEDLGWDEEISPQLQAVWSNYREQLAVIQQVKIPRFISQEHIIQQQLHGFCDASESAYAAVVFLLTVNQSRNRQVIMVAAKCKVAPVKQVSLPRLELCGAVLLTRLMQCTKDSLKIELDGEHCWTDSTIVLSWLSSPPHRWQTFVANRVSEIQNYLPRENWRHVKSEDNPADCASRGIPPEQLTEQNLWWNGPPWLMDNEENWHQSTADAECSPPEEKAVKQVLQVTISDSLLFKYSSLPKLLRVTAYCLRVKNWRKDNHPTPRQQPSPVTAGELNEALLVWLKIVQAEEFSEEFQSLKTKTEVSFRSKLKRLSPYLDPNGLIRVGGRLQKSLLHSDEKHQIILPKKNYLTQLIISDQHNRDLHAGPQALLTSLQQKYWILAGRDVVRQFVRKCVKCSRFRAECMQQKMGELPSVRVTPAPPFQKTGVDFAGPFAVTARRGRGQRSFKSYVSLFVCMVTKAIHLELVSDLTTDAFLAALRRFTARRGRPTDIYSDCGTNFLGAKRTLEEQEKIFNSKTHHTDVQRKLAADHIQWHLNAPSGPHHGGIWEAGVKAMKYHLRRVVGATILTTEEMGTLLTQIEACLNSRPLTELSTDPADLQPLTPGHFLIGRPLTSVGDPDLTHLKESHLSRWQKIQHMTQHFWKRWSTEVLTRYQQRNKWHKEQPSVEIGTLVLIKDDNLPPANWKLGKITDTHPGKDELVRIVTVKTATGNLVRPITKLCILPV